MQKFPLQLHSLCHSASLCFVVSVPKAASLYVFPTTALVGLHSPTTQGNTKTSASTTITITAPQRLTTLSVATSLVSVEWTLPLR